MNEPGTDHPQGATSTPSLGDKATRGIAWMVSQAAVNKVVTTIGQMILGMILVPEDYGLVALTYMFGTASVLIQQGGLHEVLIKRKRHFHRWANSAFWMSMCLGVVGCAIMVAFAPVAGTLCDDDRLTRLMLIMALFFPIDAFCTVPLALAHGRMQFRFIAAVQLGQSVVAVSLSILLAMLDWGPFAAIAPRPVVPLIGAIAYWIKAPVPLRRGLQFRRWRYLVGDSALVFAANCCDMAILYLGTLALSVAYNKSVVGDYFFMFNLSLQTMVLISLRLRGVLFPALSTLADDPQRQSRAFLRALRLISFVVLPACLLQAALSDAGVRAIYAGRWSHAIPMLQVLSIGMAIRSVGWPAVSMLQAQGRFGTRLVLVIISLVSQAILICLGLWWFGPIGVALATTVNWIVIDPVSVYVAVRHTGYGWRDVARALGPPAALGLLVVGPAVLVDMAIPDMAGRDWWRVALITSVAAALYVPMFRTLAPEAWQEMRQRLVGMLGRSR